MNGGGGRKLAVIALIDIHWVVFLEDDFEIQRRPSNKEIIRKRIDELESEAKKLKQEYHRSESIWLELSLWTYKARKEQILIFFFVMVKVFFLCPCCFKFKILRSFYRQWSCWINTNVLPVFLFWTDLRHHHHQTGKLYFLNSELADKRSRKTKKLI